MSTENSRVLMSTACDRAVSTNECQVSLWLCGTLFSNVITHTHKISGFDCNYFDSMIQTTLRYKWSLKTNEK